MPTPMTIEMENENKMNTQEAIDILEGLFGEEFLSQSENEALTHAIEYMKRGQWQPIAKIQLTSSGPNWDFSDRVLFRIFYKETGIVTFDVGRVMIDNLLNRCELPDNKYLEYDRITHFYDLSNLPEPPQKRKD